MSHEFLLILWSERAVWRCLRTGLQHTFCNNRLNHFSFCFLLVSREINMGMSMEQKTTWVT